MLRARIRSVFTATAVVVLAALLAPSLGCGTTPPPRTTEDPTDGPKPPENSGPFQAEEAKEHGPPQVVIMNGTEGIVNVEFAGPNASKLSITPGDTQSFTSIAGTYAVTLSDPLGQNQATTLDGVALEDDYVYTWIIRLKAVEPPP